jgi:hypothetical protein
LLQLLALPCSPFALWNFLPCMCCLTAASDLSISSPVRAQYSINLWDTAATATATATGAAAAAAAGVEPYAGPATAAARGTRITCAGPLAAAADVCCKHARRIRVLVTCTQLPPGTARYLSPEAESEAVAWQQQQQLLSAFIMGVFAGSNTHGKFLLCTMKGSYFSRAESAV